MDTLIKKIDLFYEQIYLQSIVLPQPIPVEQIKFETSCEFDYAVSIPNIRHPSKANCYMSSSYLVDKKLCGIDLKQVLTENSQKIIKYLDVLSGITDNAFIDDVVSIKNRNYGISYARIIAERNLEISKSLFFNLANNNQLICNFLLRDLIENIKLYLYFLRGAKSETIIKDSNHTYIREQINNETINTIKESLQNGNRDWGFNIKQILKNNPSLTKWKKELQSVEQINQQCNATIHKNGLTKITPQFIKLMSPKIDFDMVYTCIKLFFTLITCYDGKILSSSDYVDYLDNGAEPPADCQYWLAPIFQDFINQEYSPEDIQKLKEFSYMNIE